MMDWSSDADDELSPAARAYMALLLQEEGVDLGAAADAIAPRGDAAVELSFAQQRLWFLAQLEPASAAYNVPAALRITGSLDAAALARSLGEVVRRHEVLRTAIHTAGGRPLAEVVDTGGAFALPAVDLSGLSAARRRTEAHRLVDAEMLRPFDLAQAPLLRGTLLIFHPAEHLLLLTLHHIVSDGWSVGILVREVGALYPAFHRGLPAPLPALAIQYADFAAWQRRRLSGELLDGQLAYWRERLAGAPPVIALPSDRPRPPVRDLRGARLPFCLPAALGAAVDAFGAAEGATAFMTLVAAAAAWLHRHGAGDDLVLGSPIAGRMRAEVEGLIGFFANSLVLRIDLAGGASWRALLARVRETTLGAYEHQEVPFERIVEKLVPARDLSYNPLFQVLVALQNAPVPALSLAGLTLGDWDADLSTARFDLSLDLEEERRWTGKVEYAADLFDAVTVERMIGHLERLLAAAVEAPDRPLAELPLLAAAERHQLLTEWSDTPAPAGGLLPDLVAAQAARTPERPAVTQGDERLTYRELAARVETLAAHLRGMGVGPDVLVAPYLDRSADLVVALLGVMKAGGAYLPLELSHPRERLAGMLADSRAAFVLTRARFLPDLPAHAAQTVLLDELRGDPPPPITPTTGPAPPDPDHLAYVLFTSGSTGKPKGVAVTHGGLANYLAWAAAAYPAGRGRGAPVHSPVGFDLTVTSLFLPLLAGSGVVLVPEEEGVAGLAAALETGGFGLVKLTPAHLELLRRMLPPARVAGSAEAFVIGGEPLTGETLAFWREHAPGLRLINEYGPTETVVGCSVYEVPPGSPSAGPVPIGRPIAGTRLYVLDADGLPVPAGVAGELHIGGAGVCRGYLHRPELTAERFVPDPFGDGGRLYRSGDLVRWRSDGALDFLGRIDSQVKIRGFRIELGEIEAALLALPGVREAAVTVREDTPGHPRLVAYAAGADGLAAEALREGLRARLPGYMVPAACVTLAALPLTANGKVDLKALPAPERTAAEAVRRAPESALEKTVAAVWQEVLAVGQVGLDDNFFDRGGHSLLLVEVQGKLSEQLGREIKIVDLFTYPTIGALARFLSRGEDRTAARAQEERMVERWSRAGAGAQGGTGTQPPIAIVGMAGRFPGGPGGLESFWAMLRDGREGISFFTDEELLAAGIDPRLLASPHYVKAGATLAGADLFDAEFFEILPREAEILDPQQRLLLECAAEALERAGYAGTERPVGVFAGASDSTYWLHNLATRPELTESAGLFAINLANSRDFVATRLSYELNLSGTSLTVQTACSTSLVAVHLACQSLIAGECELALAGGASVRAPQKSGHLYQPGGILSPDGHCRAFDARGEGTLGGQGVGLVVLKRLDEAIADGDPIHAVIRGSALTNDGLAKAGFTAPGLDGQAKAIRAAHRRAGVEPDSIAYVETHGTATPLGDLVEIAALTRAFRLGTERRGFCALGSVKTNIGHLDAAAGVAGLIKTVLALENAAIPPSLHFEVPNPQIDFAASPFFVNTELRAWRRENGIPRRAGVSSFGLGGTNAHVVLEEAPEREPSGPSRPWQVLLLSARTATALETATDNLADHLEADPDQNLADAAYTLRVGRWPFAHRRAVVAASVEEAAAALRARDPKRVWNAVSEPASRPVAFLLPGVGDQYPGIARGLYRDEPVFREEIDRCAELLLPHLGLDLRDALFAGDEDGETAATSGTDLRVLLGRAKQEDRREAAARALLQETRIAQPAMFAVGYALARLWMSWGVQPQALLGYSLGEYTAACLAGVLELPDALALVAQRARLIGGLEPGAMLAVPLSEAATRALLGAELSLAAVNAPEVSVAAGPPAAIAELEARLAAAGTPGRRLQTEQAFHSSSMQPIAEALRELVRAVPLAPPRLPYLSNVTGTWIEPAQATDPDYWVRHLLSTVRFADGVAELWREPRRILLEMGPGQTLGSLALQQSADGGIVLSALRHERDRQPDQRFLLHTLGRLWLAGAAIDGSGFHRGERRRRVILPTYPFERRRFWIEAATAAPYARTEAPAPVQKPADMAEWFHVPTWQRAPRRRRAAVLEGSWLVLCDPLGLGDRLARRLTDAGCTVETPAPQDAAGFDRWPARILHLWSLGAAPGGLSLPGLARKLMQRAGTVEICVIADGLCDVERHDALDVEKAALLGEIRALSREHPGLACRLIDVDAGEIGENLEARLLAEIAGPRAEPGPESIIALRGPHRWAPDLAPLPLAPVAGRPALLREGGAYLITGGRRDLASALAAHLARAAAVLEIAEDVADGPALRSALTAARQRLGRIDGVFHAAAPGEPAEAVRALESALAGDPPGFLALFSPLGDALGVGPAEGCAAAAVRSALARRSARGGMPVLAVAWSPRWDDPAEAAAAMQALDRILDSSLPEILVAPRGLAAARQPQPSDEGTEPPAPRAERSARPSLQTPYTAPATAVEETMAELWGELLGIAPIGVHDDFFQLGGHSLLGLQLTSRIQARLGVELPQGALFEAPTVAELAARVEEALQAGAGRPAPPLTPIAPELRQGPLPLSFAQQRLWFIDQLEPGKANYHIPVTLRAEGPLDAAGLALCLGEIVRRHEALRTVFAAAGDSPVQVVQPPAPFALPVIDLSGLPESRREALAPVLAAAEAAQPFDLARGPLLRGILLRMAAADHIAALTMHHIVSDGWSLGLLIREVGTLYRALLEGRPSPLPALPIQYADFAVWQSRWLDAAALAGLAEHWRRRLAGAPLQLDLPEAKPRPAVLSSRGASRQRRLAAPLPEQLRALGRRESASLFMTLLAPLFALLHARTGAADLVVGTDVAGRDQRATEGLIGFFIKQLPLRAELSGDPTLRELLRRVRETALEAYAHQDLPFDHLVEALRVKPSLQRSPIFQVKLVLQNAQQERLDLPDLTLRVVPLEADTAQLDLHWSAAEIGGELWLTLNYSTDLFDEPSIDRLLDQYEICLRALVERPEVRLGALAAELAQAERTRRAERDLELKSMGLGKLRRRQAV